MSAVMTGVRERLHQARLRLKGFVYSGPGRDRWQHPDRVVEALSLRPGQRVAAAEPDAPELPESSRGRFGSCSGTPPSRRRSGRR
jgi:hypothetical protein